MRKIIPYNPKLKSLAKKLRQNMTLSEVLLWDELKQKKIKGYDFDRQKPIDEFIVDFYCKDLKLAIEVDGDSHDNETTFNEDTIRQSRLEQLGVHFLRFDDLEVKKDIGNVIRTIEIWIEEYIACQEPTPTTPERGIGPLKTSVSPSLEGNDTLKGDNKSISLEYTSKEESSNFTESNPLLGGVGVGKTLNKKILLDIAKQAALAAGEEILKIYESGDFSIEAKSDNSPLTIADKAAHNKIVSYLEKTGIPILSEEGKSIPFEERSQWEYFWMVDPLDGTKEFIKKNGEFTVNIALIHKGESILGVVYPPVLNELYWAIKGEGAFKKHENKIEKLSVSKRKLDQPSLKVVASRSHMSPETENYLNKLNLPEIVSKGSSLKFLLIASGEADVYPRFGPTMEWDTAAAHIIVSEAGGSVTLEDEKTKVSYNKESLLNPTFIVLPFQI